MEGGQLLGTCLRGGQWHRSLQRKEGGGARRWEPDRGMGWRETARIGRVPGGQGSGKRYKGVNWNTHSTAPHVHTMTSSAHYARARLLAQDVCPLRQTSFLGPANITTNSPFTLYKFTKSKLPHLSPSFHTLPSSLISAAAVT